MSTSEVRTPACAFPRHCGDGDGGGTGTGTDTQHKACTCRAQRQLTKQQMELKQWHIGLRCTQQVKPCTLPSDRGARGAHSTLTVAWGHASGRETLQPRLDQQGWFFLGPPSSSDGPCSEVCCFGPPILHVRRQAWAHDERRRKGNVANVTEHVHTAHTTATNTDISRAGRPALRAVIECFEPVILKVWSH